MMMVSYFITLVKFLLVGSEFLKGLVFAEYELPIRTLIISADNSKAKLPELVINSRGGDYDILNLEKKQELKLETENGKPKYNSLIFESNSLGAVNEDGVYYTNFTSEMWQKVYDYQKKYKVRSVYLSTSYTLDENIVADPNYKDGTNRTAVLSFMKHNQLAENIKSNVKLSAEFIVGKINSFLTVFAWYYPSFLSSKQNKKSTIEPFMTLNPLEDDGSIERKNWLGAFIRTTNGREEMHFTVNVFQYGHHSFVLADIWYLWLHRGIFTGLRRLHLGLIIDDLLLSTGLYNVEEGRPAREGEPEYRATCSDLRELVRYKNLLNKKLPRGSNFKFQLAFNGNGYGEGKKEVDPINQECLKIRDEFYWVSHGYSHQDFNSPNSNGHRLENASYDIIYEDIRKNKEFAKKVLYRTSSLEEFEEADSFSHRSLVTPKITGLENEKAVEAMADNNIKFVVGDNSRKELLNKNRFLSARTNKDAYGRWIYIIPRNPTRLYYDVSTPREAESEHNAMYGPNCHRCEGSFRYNGNLTFLEILWRESYEVVRKLLNYRMELYMFHQANLRLNKVDGRSKTYSLISMWVDAVVGYITKYTEMPVLTCKLDDLGKLYLEREERDSCGIKIFVMHNDQHEPEKLRVTSTEQCVVKITKSTGATKLISRSLAITNVEQYGPDTTYDIDMKKARFRGNRYEVVLELVNGKDFNSLDHIIEQTFINFDNKLHEIIKEKYNFINEFEEKYKVPYCYSQDTEEDISSFTEYFDEVSSQEKLAPAKSTSIYNNVTEELKKLKTFLEQEIVQHFNNGAKITKAQKEKIDSEITKAREQYNTWATNYILAQQDKLLNKTVELMQQEDCITFSTTDKVNSAKKLVIKSIEETYKGAKQDLRESFKPIEKFLEENFNRCGSKSTQEEVNRIYKKFDLLTMPAENRNSTEISYYKRMPKFYADTKKKLERYVRHNFINDSYGNTSLSNLIRNRIIATIDDNEEWASDYSKHIYQRINDLAQKLKNPHCIPDILPEKKFRSLRLFINNATDKVGAQLREMFERQLLYINDILKKGEHLFCMDPKHEKEFSLVASKFKKDFDPEDFNGKFFSAFEKNVKDKYESLERKLRNLFWRTMNKRDQETLVYYLNEKIESDTESTLNWARWLVTAKKNSLEQLKDKLEQQSCDVHLHESLQNSNEDITSPIKKTVEKLKKNLKNQLKFIYSFLDKYKAQKCYDKNVQKEIDKVSEQFHAVTLPAADARRGSPSYYKEMEDTFRKLLDRLERTYYLNKGDSMPLPMKIQLETEVKNAISSNEDWASDYSETAYKKFQDLEKQLTSLSLC